MASDPVVTLSDGHVTLEPSILQSPDAFPSTARCLTWRARRLSSGSELGVIQLVPDPFGESPVRARLEIKVDAGADTATVQALAQAVRLACSWAFSALNLAVITWLGPSEPSQRAVVNEVGFRVHPFPQRRAIDGPSGPIDAWYADLTPRDARAPARRPLTVREHHVLTAMARGRSNQQIAAYLGISENTVKNHVRSILEVLQAPSRTAAVIEALRTGLVSVEFDPQ